jgi:hypothetical protein
VDFAVPDPRDIPDSILVYVNFDLNKPRGILPRKRLVEDLYRCLGIQNEILKQFPNPEKILKHEFQPILRVWDLTLSKSVVTLLHTSKDSRARTRQLFSLDLCPPVEAWNNMPWDPTTDMLYLPGLACGDDLCFSRWLYGEERVQPRPGLKFVTHIALKATPKMMEAFPCWQYGNGRPGQWLKDFHALRQLSLCMDPEEYSKTSYGHAIPYSTNDVRLTKDPDSPLKQYDDCSHPNTSSGIKEHMESFFEVCLEDLEPLAWRAAPFVEVSILEWEPTLSKVQSARHAPLRVWAS